MAETDEDCKFLLMNKEQEEVVEFIKTHFMKDFFKMPEFNTTWNIYRFVKGSAFDKKTAI